MTAEHRVTVYGNPAPQGSKSYKGMRNGRPILAESSKGVAPWQNAIRAAVIDAHLHTLHLARPVHVDCTFAMRRPAAHWKPDRATLRDGAPTWVTTTPDLDKLLRSTYDALVKSGVLADDKFIVSGGQRQVYAQGFPHADIHITVLQP